MHGYHDPAYGLHVDSSYKEKQNKLPPQEDADDEQWKTILNTPVSQKWILSLVVQGPMILRPCGKAYKLMLSCPPPNFCVDMLSAVYSSVSMAISGLFHA